MMVPYVVFNEGGEILRRGNCQDRDLLSQAGVREDVLMLEYKEDTYIHEGILVAKTVGEATVDKTEVDADGVDSVVISGYSIATKIRVEGPVEYLGTLDPITDFLIFEIPGEYHLYLTSIEQKDQEFVIYVN